MRMNTSAQPSAARKPSAWSEPACAYGSPRPGGRRARDSRRARRRATRAQRPPAAPGWSAAAASARPRSGATTGAASAFAATAYGDRAEMEPENRRGDEPRMREGDRDRLGQRPRQRVALEPPTDPRNEYEDRGDGAERELEAGLEEAVRIPREQDSGTDEQEVPAVARSGREPRKRRQSAGDTGPDRGGLPPDGEHVRRDRSQSGQLADSAREEPERQTSRIVPAMTYATF